MPVQDWTRVSAGIFHDFHTSWITHVTELLNIKVLPADHYALSEQRLAVAQAPPQVTLSMEAAEMQAAAQRQRRVVVRHTSGHQVIAVIEIVSPANKDRPASLAAFVRKAVEAIDAGVHLLVIDLFPPGLHDPAGIHGAIWHSFGSRFDPPADEPLLVVAYRAAAPPTAYLEPLSVGSELPTMPLFLTPEVYINLPLASSHQAAWAGVPTFWREVVEGRRAALG